MSVQSKNFTFTINNHSEEELAQARMDPPASPIQYIGFEEENIGVEGKTPHMQGFVSLKKRKTVSGAKSIPLFKRAHLEVMKGRLEHSEAYCSKEGKLECFGERPVSSKEKGDMEKERHHLINRLAKEGNLDEIERIAPDVWRRDYNRLQKIQRDFMRPGATNTSLENLWVYGPTGTGKTRKYREMYPDAYIKDADTKWWDGYDPLHHETVIIDDFDKYHVKQGYHLKLWADHYPFKAETKGGAMMIRPKRIIVTSNYRINDIWEDETTVGPLLRRFKEVEMLTAPVKILIEPNVRNLVNAGNYDVTVKDPKLEAFVKGFVKDTKILQCTEEHDCECPLCF